MYRFRMSAELLFRTPSAEVLRELSDSRYTVYDVLPAFFSHDDPYVTIGETARIIIWVVCSTFQ